MATRDPRVDAYIAKQKDFAKPVLVHLRDLVHAGGVSARGGDDKMERPVFCLSWCGAVQCGRVQGARRVRLLEILAARGAWAEQREWGGAAGSMGRLTSIRDLPGKKQLTAFIKAAMTLNEEGIAVARPKGARKAEPNDSSRARGRFGEEQEGHGRRRQVTEVTAFFVQHASSHYKGKVVVAHDLDVC